MSVQCAGFGHVSDGRGFCLYCGLSVTERSTQEDNQKDYLMEAYRKAISLVAYLRKEIDERKLKGN